VYSDSSTQIVNALHEGRFAEAEQLLARWLETDPYDAASRSLRALCLAALKRGDEALAEARQAVEDEPELGYCHWALGHVLADAHQFTQALGCAREAAVLTPGSPEPHALAARCLAERKDWAGTLAAADRGLALDPEHPTCANLRALALQVLRSPEAEQAFVDASAADPGNAFARAGRGWQALQGGAAPDVALPHFYHALEIDPRQEWAREGLAAALKARNPVYRMMLRYFLWMDSLSPQTRWMVIIGGVAGYNLLRRVSRAQPALAPFIVPLLVAYGLFVLMTWVADPLFDALLALDKKARAAMPPGRARAGAVIAAVLAVALGLGVAGLARGDDRLLLAAIAAALLVIPTSGIFRCRPGWPRRVMGAYTAVAAALAVGGLAGWSDAGDGLLVLSLLASGVGSWLATALSSVGPRR
jgi:tetratricopeptide (TPR) repeat protein